MRKRQKFVLIIYFYAVLLLGFLYVPYNRHLTDCSERYIGHHLRFKIWGVTPWQPYSLGVTTIDANLIIAELLALTAMTVVVFLLLKRDQ